MKRLTFSKFLLASIFILLAWGGVKAQNVYLDEAFSSGSLPNGWTEEKDVSSSASWSYSNGVVTFNGGNRSEASAAFITNAVDLSASIMPTLSFSYSSQHARGAVDSLVVFYRTADRSSWTQLFVNAKIQSTLTNVSFELAEVQQAEDFQLKFEAWNNYGAGVVIDDVKIVNTIACNIPPTEFRVVSLKSDEVSFMWNPGIYADSSRVIVATEEIKDFKNYDSSIVVSDVIQRNSSIVNRVNVGSLTADTEYYAYLQVSCGSGDVSTFIALQFKTPCAPVIVDDSYTQSFESLEADCWLFVSNAETSHQIVPDKASAGLQSLYMYTGKEEYTYAVIPVDVDLTEKQISFSLLTDVQENNDIQSEIHVGVIDNPGDLSSITEIRTIKPTLINEWQKIIVTFTAYSGTGKYIVLYTGETEKENKIWIDDFSCGELQSCYAPQFPKTEEVLAYSADLSWTELGQSKAWYIKVSNVALSSDDLDAADQSSLIRVTSLPYTLENLTEYTTYYVYVSSDCGNWCYDPINFKTTSSFAIGDNDKFNYSSIDATEYYYGNLVLDGTGKWVEFPLNSHEGAPEYSYDNNTDNSSEGGSLRLYSSFDEYANVPFVIFSEFEKELSLNDVQVSFWTKVSDIDQPIIVSVCDGNDISTAYVIDTLNSAAVNTWEKHIVSLNGYTGTGRNLAISSQFEYRYNPAFTFNIDDLNIETYNACNPIMGVAIRDIHPTDVSISWASAGASSASTWTVDLYNQEIGDDDTLTPVLSFPATTPEMVLTGLKPYTDYYAYVRLNSTDCPDSEYSAPVKFTTESTFRIPYYNDFSNEPIDKAPIGWTCYNPTHTPTQYFTYYPFVKEGPWYIANGNKPSDLSSPYLYFNSYQSYPETYAIMPVAEEYVDMSKLTIQFYALASDNSCQHNLVVGIMDDPNDVSTFTPVDSITVLDEAALYKYVINTDNYTGNGRYLAFKAWTDGSEKLQIYLDNLYVYETSDCGIVTNISVTNTSATSIDVEWTEAGDETSWNVKVLSTPVEFNEVDDIDAEYVVKSINTKTKPVSITNLDIEYNTDYWVAVQSKTDDCVGAWIIQPFNTGCDFTKIELPYIENFNTYGIGDFTSPDCWYLKSYGTYNQTRVDLGYEYPDCETGIESGASLVMVGTAEAGYSYAVMPRIDSLKYTSLSFQLYSPKLYSYVEIGVVEDIDDSFKDQSVYYTSVPVNDDKFKLIKRYELSNSDVWEVVTADFASYNGSGDRVAFRIGNHSQLEESKTIAIDSLVLSRTPDCAKITVVSTDILTYNSATISWSTLDETEWDIRVASSEIDPDEDDADILSARVTSMPYTITGLTDNTNYYVYLRRVSSENGGCVGEWSDGWGFITACAPISVGYSDDFELNATAEDDNARCWAVMGTSDVLPYTQMHSRELTGIDATDDNMLCYAFENSTTSYQGVADQRFAYAALPEVLVDTINKVQINFRAYTPSCMMGQFEVGVATYITTLDSLSTSYVSVYRDTIPDGIWTNYQVNFTNYTTDDFGDKGKYIVFNALPGTDMGGNMNNNLFYIDDVSISYYNSVGCEVPFRVKADSIGEEGAKLSWTANQSSQYQVIVNTEPISDINASIVDTLVTTNPAVIDGLPKNTMLYAFVRSQCEDGSFTEWSQYTEFHTYGCEENKLPFVEGFEYELDMSEHILNCWEFYYYTVNDNPANYQISTENPFDGKYGLELPSGMLAVLPMSDISDLVLSGNILLESPEYHAEAGVVRMVGDSVRFISLQNIVSGSGESFEVRYCDYDTIQPGDKMAILAVATVDLYHEAVYFDNIYVNRENALEPIDGLRLNDITENSASLSWNLSNDVVDVVEVALLTEGQSISQAAMYTLDSAPFDSITIDDLALTTTYTVYVRAKLGSETTIWSNPLEFTTYRMPANLPYFNDWENETINSDWTLYAEGGLPLTPCTTWWMVGDDTYYEGDKSLYITFDGTHYNYTSGTTSAWALRTVKITEPGTYVVSGVAKCPTNEVQDHLTIAFMPVGFCEFDGCYLRNPYTGESFRGSEYEGKYIVKGKLNNSYDWTEYSRQFEITEPGLYNIVLLNYIDYSTHGGEGAGAVDNISVMKFVYAPTDLTVADITANSANISWAVNEQIDSCKITIKADNFVKEYVVLAEVTNLQLTELSDNVEYTVSVVAIEAGSPSLATSTTFKTPLAPVRDYAYTNNMNDSIENCKWFIDSDDYSNKWMFGVDTYYSDSMSLYISPVYGDDKGNYAYGSGNTNSWVMRDFEFDAPGVYNISMMAKCPSFDSEDYLSVSFIPSSFIINTNGESYEDPATGKVYNMNNVSYDNNPFVVINKLYDTEDTWTNYSRNVAIPEAGLYKLAVLYHTNYDDFENASPAAIDSVVVAEMPCAAALSFSLDAINHNSASISWAAGTSVTWYEVKVSTEDVDDVANLSSTVFNGTIPSPTVDITSLVANTTYYIYVKAICDDANDYVKFAFETVNTPIDVPYFNHITCDLNDLPEYWIVPFGLASVAYDVIDPAINTMDTTMLVSHNTTIVLPIFASSINSLELAFDAVSAIAGAQVSVGVISIPTDETTFETLATFDVAQYASPSEAISDYISYKFDTYAGNAGFIAIRSSSKISIDDIIVDVIGNCNMPADLVLTSVEDYSATATWSNSGVDASRVVLATANAYDIQYLQASDIVLDTVLTSSEQSISVVTDDKTQYYIYVSSTCGDDNTHAAKREFTTRLGKMKLPHHEPIDFTSREGFTDKGWSCFGSYYDFNTGQLPGDTIVNICMSPYIQFLELSSEYDINRVGVDIEAVTYGWGTTSIVIGALETPGDVSSFVGLDTVMAPGAPDPFATTTLSANLSRYVGESKTICLHVPVPGDLWLDDINIYELTPCMAPGALSIYDLNDISAKLSFIPVEGQTEWKVIVTKNEYAEDQLDIMTSIVAVSIQDVTVTSDIDLTGLSERTNYYVYVKAIAGCDDVAEWSEACQFTTPRGKLHLPFYEPITGWDGLNERGWSVLRGSVDFMTGTIAGDTLMNIYSNPYLAANELDEQYDVSNIAIDFKSMAYSSSAYPIIVVGVLETAGQTSSFVGLDTVVAPPASNALQQFTTRLVNYTGTSKHLCIYVPGPGDLYIDDIYIYEITPCLAPYDLVVSDVTHSTANISFTPIRGQEQWCVVAVDRECTADELNSMTADDVAFMQDVTAYSNVEISGLKDLSNYYVYVRGVGNCDDTPQWSECATLSTPFKPLNSPYFETFTDVEDNKLPKGWARANSKFTESSSLEFMDTESFKYKYFSVKSESNMSSAPYLSTSMDCDAETPVYNWAIGPDIIVEGSGTMGFDLELTPNNNYMPTPDSLYLERPSEIILYISSDNGATWNEEVVISDTKTDDYHFYDFLNNKGRVLVDMMPYVGDTIRFAFYINNEDIVNLDVNIDNISINCVGERTYDDVISEGYDYTENGFDIFYADLEAGTTASYETYISSNELGICDTIYTVNLTVLENVVVNLTGEICAEGDVYDQNGFTESYAGLYVNYDVAASGADSITYLTLTYREPNPITSITDFICDGSEYSFGGMIYTEAGVYRDTLADVNGCDSIIELTLEFIEAGDIESLEATICEGDYYSITGSDIKYTKSGVYTEDLQTENGCDYTVELTLTVLDIDTTYVDETINLDELPYTHRDMTFDENTVVGEYTHEFSIDNGTDCPDVEIYTLKVIEGEVAVDNTRILDLSMYPNPLTSGATLYVDAEFTSVERDGMVIEVMNTVGQLIVRENPATDEITINGLTESGVYIVRITTGTGVQYLGKVIVK